MYVYIYTQVTFKLNFMENMYVLVKGYGPVHICLVLLEPHFFPVHHAA